MSAKPKQEEFQYIITKHVCRVCFGRVLMRETFDHVKIYKCSNCGVERTGERESAICCCGTKLRYGKDMGIRCIPNPDVRPEFPSEIVAVQAIDVTQN